MLAPGSEFGRYTVRQRLGAGGVGDVYLAFDPQLDRQVALKVLSGARAGDTNRLARFVREARAASALNHPSILRVLDFGSHEGTRFLVTEFVEGRTLREWAEAERPAIGEVLGVMAQAALALAAAHEAGIVHRDVKPENLMIGEDGVVKVLDFGIAKLVDESREEPDASLELQVQTLPGMILGTTRYMSPEQALGTAIDARSDVWSLGVVLYELLAGRPPFKASTPMGTLAAIVGRAPVPLDLTAPDTPEAVCRIVERALRKKPGERYETAAEMADDLARVRRELRGE